MNKDITITYAQIAQELDKPVSTVLSYARRKLSPLEKPSNAKAVPADIAAALRQKYKTFHGIDAGVGGQASRTDPGSLAKRIRVAQNKNLRPIAQTAGVSGIVAYSSVNYALNSVFNAVAQLGYAGVIVNTISALTLYGYILALNVYGAVIGVVHWLVTLWVLSMAGKSNQTGIARGGYMFLWACECFAFCAHLFAFNYIIWHNPERFAFDLKTYPSVPFVISAALATLLCASLLFSISSKIQNTVENGG